ncbi:hypothetical protein [Deferribacter desulfuricans]|uniref:hypothetical protein n=1 Tax=Deferribacter desulfuricans TaxID=197162 RepID=UPI00030B250B|nr:hypothetical protein [Deferribacter desulfuricans]
MIGFLSFETTNVLDTSSIVALSVIDENGKVVEYRIFSLEDENEFTIKAKKVNKLQVSSSDRYSYESFVNYILKNKKNIFNSNDFSQFYLFLYDLFNNIMRNCIFDKNIFDKINQKLINLQELAYKNYIAKDEQLDSTRYFALRDSYPFYPSTTHKTHSFR